MLVSGLSFILSSPVTFNRSDQESANEETRNHVTTRAGRRAWSETEQEGFTLRVLLYSAFLGPNCIKL